MADALSKYGSGLAGCGIQLVELPVVERLGKEAAKVFEEDVEVKRVGWGSDKVEVFVEAAGGFVFGVDGEGADADDVGCLQGAEQSVAKKGLSYPLALPTKVYG
jgi:hypothetical protein